MELQDGDCKYNYFSFKSHLNVMILVRHSWVIFIQLHVFSRFIINVGYNQVILEEKKLNIHIFPVKNVIYKEVKNISTYFSDGFEKKKICTQYF